MAESRDIGASLYGAVDLSSLVSRAEQADRGARSGATAQAGTTSGPGTAGSDEVTQARADAAAAGAEPIAVLPDAVIDGDEQTLQEFMQLSQFMPVLVEMHAKWSSEAQALSPVLAKIVRSAGGRTVLARIDLDAHPALGQQPQVLAIIGGRPLQLFAGNPPEDQLRQLIGEVLQLAEQQGLRGFVQIEGASADAAADAPAPEPELPPLHREAYEAVDRGDYAGAIDAFDRALAENPADDDAKAGRAQIALLQRLQGKTLDAIRQAAADGPGVLEAQLDVADLDLSGGHIEDAFDRLLTLFPAQDTDGKSRLRERLLELFLVVGSDDPRVAKARARLTNLLF